MEINRRSSFTLAVILANKQKEGQFYDKASRLTRQWSVTLPPTPYGGRWRRGAAEVGDWDQNDPRDSRTYGEFLEDRVSENNAQSHLYRKGKRGIQEESSQSEKIWGRSFTSKCTSSRYFRQYRQPHSRWSTLYVTGKWFCILVVLLASSSCMPEKWRPHVLTGKITTFLIKLFMISGFIYHSNLYNIRELRKRQNWKSKR